MTDFDYQWKNLLSEKDLENEEEKFHCNNDRVKEFLQFTSIKSWFKKDCFIKGKICLDAGSGPGRWTCAMQKLGANKVDSFDLSEEGVRRCKEINPNAYVFDIWNLKPNPIYDFVLSWGVLHHTKNTREAFKKVASQVKKGGMLHVMIYNKENDWAYEGFRGETCVEKHEYWLTLSEEEKINLCKKMVKKYNGNIHGWFDAFNPMYNWSHSANEVQKWFEEEGFSKIKLKMVKQNINMNGILD
jgi:2-polyprenyl-3-methyl-5-hydroxy-6-metoxy-1,4-benzoquinol methylase